MKIGFLGLIGSDWTDVNYEKLRWAVEHGFHGVGAHLSVPASTIPDERAQKVKQVFADQNMPLLQVWGPYPCIITPDENVRRAGVEGARDLVKLAAKLGIKESGVRATSISPLVDYGPHPDNYKPETEDRLVKSLKEILQTAEDYGIDVVLETHILTTLSTAEAIKRIIERTESKRLKLNLDPCNFVGDVQTAYNPPPMLNHIFDLLGPYTATLHCKDYYMENRLTMHVAETIIGTGMMDFDTILTRFQQLQPNGYAVIEHLPISLVPVAKRNLTQKIKDLGLPLG